MTRTFDYTAYKAAFRKAAVARGIDPLEGATSYQVANLKAEQARRAILDAADYGWWRGRAIFSEAEARAWGNVCIVPVDANRIADDATLVPFDGATIAELWREVAREVVEPAALSLHGLHQHQRVWEVLRNQKASIALA